MRSLNLGWKPETLLLLGFALLAASCSDPGMGPTTHTSSPSVATVQSTTTTVSSTTVTTTTLPPGPTVVPDSDQEGLAAPLWDDTAYGEPAYLQSLGEIAATGAEWVTIIPTWYQDSVTSSEVLAETEGRTATDESLTTAIGEARSLGLEVMLKPHVDIASGGSRLAIEPDDRSAWFESYGEMILHYAAMATENDVGQFVVGTELARTTGAEAEWRDLIADVREVYGGPLTYAANHDSYQDVAFWDALDVIGVDAYFPLADEPLSDIDELTERWNAIAQEMGEVAESVDRDLVLAEVGYPSQEGAVTRPYDPNGSTVVSVEEQDAALRAMLSALDEKPWFAGFHWWMWFEERTPEDQALGYTPKGKPAGDTLRSRWVGD